MSRPVTSECQHVRAMVMAHHCAALLGIPPRGYPLARTFERLEGRSPGGDKGERWATELLGLTQSPARAKLMCKHCPEVRTLAAHPIWSVLDGKVQSLEGWQHVLLACEPEAAFRVDGALRDPLRQLPKLVEPDHLTCLVMLLKSSNVAFIPYRSVFARGIQNSVAKLSLLPAWYPTRYRLKSLLQCQLALPALSGYAGVYEYLDEQLDDTIEAYRLLFEWGRTTPLFNDLCEPEWAEFCSVFEHAPPRQRLEILEALAEYRRHPESVFRLPRLRRLCPSALRVSRNPSGA